MQKKSAKSYCDKFDSRVLKQEEKISKREVEPQKVAPEKGAPPDSNKDRLLRSFSGFGDYQRGALTPFPIAQASWVERTIFSFS